MGQTGNAVTHPSSCQATTGKAHTYHVFDQQVSSGEGNRVGRRRDRQHEGIGAADRAWDHQVQGVHSQSDGLDGRSPSETLRPLERVSTI